MRVSKAARGASRHKRQGWFAEQPAFLNPTLPDNPCRRRLSRQQCTVIGSTQYVIYSDTVIRQREKSSAKENRHIAKCCLTLDDQTPACRQDRRQMGKEQTRQRVPGAERNREVLARDDKVRELDGRLHSHHEADCPILTYHPSINFIEARKAFSRCRFCPVVQHTLDQPPFVLPGRRYVGMWQFQHVAQTYSPDVNEI
jgi:hypothetical protein